MLQQFAGVAELADARDLKSRGISFPYRFKPGLRHQSQTICRRQAIIYAVAVQSAQQELFYVILKLIYNINKQSIHFACFRSK